MDTALKITTTVLPGHRIELTAIVVPISEVPRFWGCRG